MTTTTLFADTTNFALMNSNATPVTAAQDGTGWSATTWGDAGAGTNYLAVGQWNAGSTWEVYESLLQFDASSIPDGDTISSVTLVLETDPGFGNSVTPGQEFTHEVYAYDYGASIAAADWVTRAEYAGLTRVATFTSAAWEAVDPSHVGGGVCNFTSDAAFLTAVPVTAGTKFRILIGSSLARIGGGAPTLQFQCFAGPQNTTFTHPKLVIVHAAAAGPTPAAVPVVLATATPTITASGVPTPTEVSESLAVNTPAVTASAGVAVPAAVPMALVVETPSIVTGIIASPSAVAMTMATATPTITADMAVSVPNAVPLALAVPTPTVGVGTELQPVPLVLAVNTPSVTLGGAATPTTVPVVLAVPTPFIDTENGSLRIPNVDIAAATHAVDRLPLPPYDPTRTPPAYVAEVPYRPGGENY